MLAIRGSEKLLWDLTYIPRTYATGYSYTVENQVNSASLLGSILEKYCIIQKTMSKKIYLANSYGFSLQQKELLLPPIISKLKSLDFYNSEEGKEYLAYYEFNEETFLKSAIVGWMTVDKIFKYDEQSFAADKDLHQLGDSLTNYKNSYGYEGSNVWGITLKNPVTLNPPVCDVFQPEGINIGELWGAEDLSLLEAFDMALKAKVEYG